MNQGALVSMRIVEEGWKVGFMYRREPNNPADSGWTFFAGNEDEQPLLSPAATAFSKGQAPLAPRTTKQAEYLALSLCLIFSLYLLSAAPASWSACSSL